MKLTLRRCERDDAAAIRRLNRRLAAGGADYPVFGEDGGGGGAGPIRDRLFVAQQDGEIRGAAWLREVDFWLAGENVRGGWAKYPVAESLIDPRFAGVPAALVRQLQREQPLLLALGLGGHDSAFAGLLRAMGWTGSTIPFRFLALKPYRVLRRLRHLRRTRGRRLVADSLAFSGLGWLGGRLSCALRWAGKIRRPAGYKAHSVDRFDSWSDSVWRDARDSYGLIAVRDSSALRAAYPWTFKNLRRIRVLRGDDTVGWAALLVTDLRHGRVDEYFGPLRVALVADALARPEHAFGVLAAAVQTLRDADVDLVFSNQSHSAWISALEGLGFLKGPSNFALYCAPGMSARLHEHGVRPMDIFVNRGDCDGPRWR